VNELTRKLGRAAQVISGRERALMVIRAMNKGEEPDPRWRSISDPAQARIFDRAMGYLNAINQDLNAAVHPILFHGGRLEDLRPIQMLKEAAERLGADNSHAEFLFGLAEAVRQEYLGYALTLTSQMAAIDAIHAELSEEFEREELREPRVREQRELVWAKLGGLLKALGGPSEVPEPDALAMDNLRSQIERSFKFFRLVEPALRRKSQAWESNAGTPPEEL